MWLWMTNKTKPVLFGRYIPIYEMAGAATMNPKPRCRAGEE